MKTSSYTRYWIVLLVLLLTSTTFMDSAITAAKRDVGSFLTEGINDNPEVTFTATGIATEPMPIHVVGYNAADFLTSSWANTNLDNQSVFKAWKKGPDGSLVSSYSTKYDPYAKPKSYFNKVDTPLKLPLWCSGGNTSCRVYDLTSRAWILTGTGTAFALVREGQASVDVPNAGGSLYVKKETDEVFVVDQNRAFPTNFDWKKWNISSLVAGVLTPSQTGSFQLLTNPNRYTGSFPQYSDGTTPLNPKRITMATDQKEIDLRARVIKSYRFGETIPYKTESYTSMPAITYGYVGYDKVPGVSLYLQSSYSNRDRSGNVIFFDFNKVYKFDSITGIPSLWAELPGPIFQAGQAALGGLWMRGSRDDGQYVNDSDGYPFWSPNVHTVYLNLETAEMTYTEPSGFTEDFNETNDALVNGGYNLAFDIGDAYSSHRFTNRIGDKGGKIGLDDSRYLNHYYASQENGFAVTEMSISTYTPNYTQPDNQNEFFTFGQLINPSSQQISNGTVAWSIMTSRKISDISDAGLSFKIQNAQNMYRLESSKNKLKLVKIINGRKYLIKETYHTLPDYAWISYKIKITGDRMKIYENGGLVLDEADATFSTGTMGPYSTLDGVSFKGISYQWSDADNMFETPGAAIVDTPVTYETTYSDPENDVRLDAGTQWKFQQINTAQAVTSNLPEKLISVTKFNDSGDGKGPNPPPAPVTVGGPILSFGIVGLYKVDYKVPDNPKPSNPSFNNYRKYSEPYTQYLIIHRKPVAPFTLYQSGDGIVQWNDYSYDPDRCYNHGNCQAAFAANNAVFAKKFYYVTPSGTKKDSKLIRPLESGMYTVAMAVQDEHKAWSDWYVQELDVLIPVAPNTPPTVWLTFPNGTYATPSAVSLQPTITWNQADIDPGTVFSTFNLCIRDAANNPVQCVYNQVMETTATSWSWTLEHQLSMGQKYSAQVQVSDGESWSNWSNIGWMTTNSPPVAYMTFPYGTQAVPNIVNTLRPDLTWYQSDPDIGYVLYGYQIQITNEANNLMIFDSGKSWQNTTSTTGNMTVPIDLPTGQKMRVRVKVWDQYGAESEWSPQTWMMINRPPHADFDWTPKPAFEGDTVTLINQSVDPDGDPLSYHWQIEGPAYHSIQTTTNGLIPASITDFNPGDYKVTLTATDPYGAYDMVTKIVHVGDLAVEGFVHHTAQWELNRKAYNKMKSGEDERPRAMDIFWSGEAFVLAAKTNEKAALVYAIMSYTELQSTLTSSNLTDWTAQMYRSDFENLPDQAYTFQFRAVWPNGHMETVSRTIRINNPWTDFTSSVRKE